MTQRRTPPAIALSTEALLTASDGFAVSSATPTQRAICRARDGLDLGGLAADPAVQQAFGGPAALAALPRRKPELFLCVASPRTCKTTIAVAGGIVDSLSVDDSSLGAGEIARTSFLSLKLDVTDVPLARLKGVFRSSAALRPLLLKEPTSDGLMIETPSGRPLEFKCVAGSKAAGGLAARWSSGVLIDEGTKMSSRSDDAVTNIDDSLSVARERMLPGAQIMVIGSPWAPTGWAYRQVEERFGKPGEDIVVARMTGPAGNPFYWTEERLARLREADEVAWRVCALGEFVDAETGLLSPIAVRGAKRELPHELGFHFQHAFVAGLDLADGIVGGNASALVVLEYDRPNVKEGEPRYRVAASHEWRGVNPERVLEESAKICAHYGLRHGHTDQFAGRANADLARRFGLHLHVHPSTASSKIQSFTDFATLLHSGQIELSPEPQLQRDLLSIRRRITQNGVQIILPRSSDGRHCDLASALVLAVTVASQQVLPLSEMRQMTETMRRMMGDD